MKALTRESRGLSSNLGNKDAPSKFSSRGYTETSLKISSNSPKDAARRTRSSERFDVAIDGVITAVEIVKGPATTLLWPLKGCFESLITVLEELRASRKNKETWVDLIEHLHQQINHVAQQVENLRRNDKLDESIRNFGRSLQQVIKGMESAAIHQKTPFRMIFLNRSIPDQIRTVTSKLDSAYNTLKTDILMQVQSYAHETCEISKEHAVEDGKLHAETRQIILTHKKEDESRHIEIEGAIKAHREEDAVRYANLYGALQEYREDNLRHVQICESILNKSGFSSRPSNERNGDSNNANCDTCDCTENTKAHTPGPIEPLPNPPQANIISGTSNDYSGESTLVNSPNSIRSRILQERNQSEGQRKAGEVRTGGIAIAFRATNGGRVTGGGNTFTIRSPNVTYAEAYGIGSEVSVINDNVTIYTAA